jgi:sterol desaturase/sphingolipid hydroxylase (fatty acid hydroxylase superfamily)
MNAEFGARVASEVFTYVLAATLFTVVEVMNAGEQQTWLSRLRGFTFYLFLIVANVAAAMLAARIARGMGIAPLLRIDLTTAPASENWAWSLLGYAVFPFLGFLVFDFAYYFFHRLQHSVPFLWRFHAVHHSIEELNAFNHYHHVSEEFFRIPLLTIPLSLLIELSVPETTAVVGIILTQNHIAHANIKLGFGPLRYILTEPRYHRIHHSIERPHRDKNFAFQFPIWDVLFGTAYFPTRDEFPRTGLDHMREPKTVGQYLFPQASSEQEAPAAGLAPPPSPPGP